MKALKFLKKMMEYEMKISKEVSLGSDEEFIRELNESIKEIEALESRSCSSCKFFSHVEGTCGGVVCEKQWECSRGSDYVDNWEAKQ